MYNSDFIAANQTAILGDAFYLSCTFLIFFIAQAPGSQPRHSKNELHMRDYHMLKFSFFPGLHTNYYYPFNSVSIYITASNFLDSSHHIFNCNSVHLTPGV